MSSLPRRKIGSRACDACKIRKVRCSEVPPCTRCTSIGIECTFNKRQATRGPRSLRAKTLAEIRSIQESQQHHQQQQQQQQHQQQQHNTSAGFGTNSTTGSSSPPEESSGLRGDISPTTSSAESGATESKSRTPVSSLIVRLCIFRLRLFPVWPILDAEHVIGSLLRDPTDIETYTLANAVCAAIIAQLKLPFEGRTDDHDPATAASMAAECQRAKALLQIGDNNPEMNLNMLQISFFQHIYHENLSPGGSKSLLFLREAITIAQIMGLHRKSLYNSLPAEESQMRRRILWLLFVTERGVAMLHKLPIILAWQPNSFPPLESRPNAEQDEAHILPAFKKLVNLFWIFDQGGAFDIILNTDDDADVQRGSRLEYLQVRLQEMSAEEHESNEVQQADILVTKSWMQAVLWRASIRRSGTAVVAQQTRPYQIVNNFLSHISHYSKTALEAHGPTIELKIFEIASALTDALASNLDLLRSSVGMDIRPVDMLVQLQRLLASSRGGNKPLLTMLCARIAEVESGGSTSPPDPGLEDTEVDGDNDEDDAAFRTTGNPADRRLSNPAYLDIVRLDYASQLPMWPNIRLDPDQDINVDPGGNLGITLTQMTNESWNGWALDLSGMSQISFL